MVEVNESAQRRALSLTQPWATLVALGAKHYETRSWSTRHRDWIAIHAAKGLKDVGGASGLIALCKTEPFRGVLLAHFGDDQGRVTLGDALPLGAIVAIARVASCAPTHTALVQEQWAPEGSDERAFGNHPHRQASQGAAPSDLQLLHRPPESLRGL